MRIGFVHDARFFENFFKELCRVFGATLHKNPSQACNLMFYSFRAPKNFDKMSRGSKVIYINAEPTNASGKKCNLILDTKDVPKLRPARVPFLYLPYCSLFFLSDGITHKPAELIKTFPYTTPPKSKFCAFMYSHDVPHRVRLFDTIAKYKRVDALGKSRKNTHTPQSRSSTWYIDDAINRYKPYKFVIACENTVQNGYVTEKIITAMLAGCIPIYFGAPDIARRGFNPKSFINVQSFPSFQHAVEFVKKIDDDPVLYRQMLDEPWFVNNTLPEFYSLDYVLPSICKVMGRSVPSRSTQSIHSIQPPQPVIQPQQLINQPIRPQRVIRRPLRRLRTFGRRKNLVKKRHVVRKKRIQKKR